MINEINVTLTAFAADPERGALTEIETVSTLPAGAGGPGGLQHGRSAGAPSGRFLYGSNRGHNSITVFAIDQASGRLTAVQNEPTQGNGPRGFGIDPTGGYLFAANQRSRHRRRVPHRPATGRLTPTGQTLELGSPACVKFVRPAP